ncbi:MAG TPA: type II toxin-antitoxin system VapC family toxin [Roseiarcus sp.]|nr:type II toxin-antitoxin system VapC family toxin [Roseiarcus sp.]
MFLDASAIVSILAQEDDADLLIEQLEAAKTQRYVSPTTMFEAAMALARIAAKEAKTSVSRENIEEAQATLDEFVATVGAKEVEISGDIGRRAVEAAKLYGRLVGHRAGLNFGDCFAYACAKAHRVPLLYKGNDFGHTGVNANPI